MAEGPEVRNDNAERLPVRAVTLFSSGVAYTLREGEIDGGEVSVALTFRTTQVSDILKSLVLLDEAGTVRAATYPSRDPIGRTLQSFAVNVTENLSREDLLRQVRGAEVRVETSNAETLTGRVMGVESGQEIGPQGQTIYFSTLNLLTEDGVAAVRMDRLRLLKLTDTRLDREFRDALAVLASGSDDNRRQVTLTFSGESRRTVRVGYVSESPLWKVSYRLVLDDKERPYLQGWAMVENTTEDDWSGVRLSLISGRPVSFIQDLYQPLYIARPVVAPDIVASPFPQLHGGDMQEEVDLTVFNSTRAMPAAAPMMLAEGSGIQDQLKKTRARAISTATAQAYAPGSDLQSQATAQSAGEMFEYHINEPVDLPRQQAAMIPIVSDSFEGEKLSLYNAISDPRFPLNAYRLKNSTDLHLKAGPITVFDGGVYAGDARMEDIPPGDSRLITYAMDLAVECERKEVAASYTKETLSIRRGVLQISRFQRSQTDYTVKNKAKTARTVLVEHPFYPDWTLLTPESPTERTADRYRFAVKLEPGEARSLSVQTERPIGQAVALVDAQTNLLSQYVSTKGISEGLITALTEVVARRREIDALEQGALDAERERATLVSEQERIRKNLGAVDKESSLHRRYLTQLENQEDRLTALQEEANRLQAAFTERTESLKAYLDTLHVSD